MVCPTDLAWIVRRVRASWKVLLLAALAGAAVGFAYGLMSTPVYRAEVLVAPVVRSGASGLAAISRQLGGLASLAGISLGANQDENVAAAAILGSRGLVRDLIEEGNLLPVLFDDIWNEQSRTWKVSGKEVPSLWEGERLFSRKIRRISEDRRTGLIVVAALWKDPHRAADWANELVARADRHIRERAIQRAQANVEFLQEQLDKTGIVEVRQSIYRLIEDQMAEMMLAQGGPEYALRVLDPAVPPEQPIGPSTALLAVTGGAFVLLMALAAVLLLPGSGLRSDSQK
jgi:uncharacterized protein involved in exopolysaccharide biosynthesis